MGEVVIPYGGMWWSKRHERAIPTGNRHHDDVAMGFRVGLGPRLARVRFGTGRTTVSSGFGPFSISASGGRRRRGSGGAEVFALLVVGPLFLMYLVLKLVWIFYYWLFRGLYLSGRWGWREFERWRSGRELSTSGDSRFSREGPANG